MTVARDLARYADGLTYDDLDERTIESVKIRLLDSLACAIAAHDARPVERTRSYAVERSAASSARIVGTDETAAAEYAAMANGAAIRYLDWNDTGISSEIGCGHPSDNIATVLAAADAHGRSGEALVLATALAYEIHIRLCDAMPLRRRGWDHVIYEIVAGALGAGTLAGNSLDELEQSVSIALAGHLATYQSRAGDLSDWKALAAANAARNAIVSADLAGRGITGPNEIFEGRYGLFNQVSGDAEIDTDTFGGGGTPFRINSTYMKVNAIETHAQSAVECVQRLRDEHDIEPSEIESIRCETYGDAVGEIGDDSKWNPTTRETADHSLPYIVSRTFIDGTIGHDQFTPEKISDPEVRELIQKVNVAENPEFTEMYGEYMPHAMTVETDRGTFETRVDYPKGHEKRPFTLDDVREKFDRAVDDRLPSADRDAVVEFVRTLETRSDFEAMFRALRIP